MIGGNRNSIGSARAGNRDGGGPNGRAISSRVRSRRVLALATVLVTVSAVAGTILAASPGTAGAGIGSDRTKVSQLEHLIEKEGEHVQTLVVRYDQVESHLIVLKGEVAIEQAQLVADHRAEASAALRLRQVAVDAYISDVSAAPASFFGSGNPDSVPEQELYDGVANESLQDALITMHLDQFRTATTEGTLRSEEARTIVLLRRLTLAQTAAQKAIVVDQAILSKVNSNLLAEVNEANDRREAAEEQEAAAEANLAVAQQEQQAQATTTVPATTVPTTTVPPTTAPATTVTTTTVPTTAATTTVPTSTVTTTTVPTTTTTTTTLPPTTVPPTTLPTTQSGSGGYANPLQDISDLVPERIDQGVDYSGFGPIYAIGDGVVLSTVSSGWPGGTFIAYQLTDGPADGLTVYAAEDIEPTVQVGEQVTPNTVLGQMYEGPDGIETGWADASALGLTMAAEAGQFSGSNSTAFGYNFSQLLESLGAPGGILQNDPATGTLPADWPQWG